jgi:pyridinium-3,5-bisthiocarboxylic acid mononucleotide nickel chelatase
VRVAHFDCFSGASGDMILGSLIDAGVDADAIRAGLDSLGLPIKLTIERVKRCGIAATHARVEAPHEHVHRHLHHVEAIIDKGRLTEGQKTLAKGFFRRLAEAEAQVHGIPIEKVHFHEVGALDSIADFVGAAIGLDLLGVEKITSRSIPPGSGTIQCDHGLMPVPAPATALLLRGVPLASSTIDTELTTPTGAAILTAVVNEWIDSPAITVERIGHGAGTKDFPTQPNVLRLLVGTAANPAEADTVWVLETNLDDVPAEIIGYATERLFEAGALDVWTTAIQMKKNRPGVLLGVLAPTELVAAMKTVLFRETGTFGVRRYAAQRSTLQRESFSIRTPWGSVKAKRGWRDGVSVVTPEYEDCARVAHEHGVPLREVYKQVYMVTFVCNVK